MGQSNYRLFSIFLVFVLTFCLLAPASTPAAAVLAEEPVNIQYLGHATFVITGSDGTSILTDPAEGLATPDGINLEGVMPTAATVSHRHSDHFYWEEVPGSTQLINGTSEALDFVDVNEQVGNTVITDVYTFHFWDPYEQSCYNANATFIYNVNNVNIMHTGDIDGTLMALQDGFPTPEYTSLTSQDVDVLLLNVGPGGEFSLNADTIARFVYDLGPKVVIPMHYWGDDSIRQAFIDAAFNSYGIESVINLGNSMNITASSLPAGTEIWRVNPGAYTAPGDGGEGEQEPSVTGAVYVGENTVDNVMATITSFDATNLANLQLTTLEGGQDLSALYDSDTVFTIKVSNNGYTPFVVLGAGDIQSWNSQDGITTINVKGVNFKPADGVDPWPLAVQLAIQYDPDPALIPESYRGMHISTNGNQFTPPGMTESQKLSVMVGGASGVSDGFFRAYIPDALLQSWGVESADQLMASVDGLQVGNTVVTSVYGGMNIGFDMEFSTHQILIGSGEQAGGDDGDDGDGGGGGGSSVSANTAGGSVGSVGGTVTGQSVSISIPAGAVEDDIKVTIQNVLNTSNLSLSPDSTLVSEVLEIIKDKTGDFSKPVTITMQFDKSKIDPDKYTVGIYWYDESSNTWVELDNMQVDLAAGSISGEVTHFTKFAVIAKARAEAEDKQEEAMLDIAGHWAKDSIKRLVALGAISGYSDGTFRPDSNITRAEFVTVLVKSLKLEPLAGKVYADTAGHWARDYISAATSAGIVSGLGDGSFGPDQFITREQMAVMVVKAMNRAAASPEGSSYKDGAEISSWAGEAVAVTEREGITAGYPDGTFRPQGNTTRAEAATVISNALK